MTNANEALPPTQRYGAASRHGAVPRYKAPRAGSPLWIEMTLVSAAGAGLVVLAAMRLHGLDGLYRHPILWVAAAMIAAGQIWPIMIPGHPDQDSPAGSVTITFAALMFWGFPLAILLRAGATVGIGLAQRTGVYRTVFSAAQDAISLAAAGLVLLAAGVTPGPAHTWTPSGRDLPVVLAAGLAYSAVNFVLVCRAVALHSRMPLALVARAQIRYQAPTQAVVLATAPLVTLAMRTGSALMVALYAIPLAAIYLNASMTRQRDYQAHHDELTKLPNRKMLIKQSAEELQQAQRDGTAVGFLLLDLDRFKEVNDTLGHAVGDRLLEKVARRLSHSIRPGDLAARLGGDEFAVLLPAVKDARTAREVASRLRAALAEPVRMEAMTFDIEASVGLAIYPDDAEDFEQLMRRADVAMYLAKERRSGIERYVADADRNSAEKLALTGDLRRGLHRGELELHFQPVVRLATGEAVSMEALARWHHPERGLLPAREFIGLAEQSYLITELTEQVLDQALAQAARWRASGHRIEVCVNVPARDLAGTGLVELVTRALGKHDLPPSALRLDVGEQALAGKSAHAADTVRELSALGVGISLDDYGTGYSSLALLSRLGVTEVKLDPSLILGLPGGPAKSAAVSSLISLARSLGIRTVAEGVDTEAAAAALRAMGCDCAQGWHVGRPGPAGAAGAWLEERRGAAGQPAMRSEPVTAGL